MYNFMRLHALGVEVDVKLAIGEFTIDQAADYLEKIVPVDRATARQEAVFFASSPGQAITYQIGRLQFIKFVACNTQHFRRAHHLFSPHLFTAHCI